MGTGVNPVLWVWTPAAWAVEAWGLSDFVSELGKGILDLRQKPRMGLLPFPSPLFSTLLENHFKESDVSLPDAVQLLLKELGNIIENKRCWARPIQASSYFEGEGNSKFFLYLELMSQNTCSVRWIICEFYIWELYIGKWHSLQMQKKHKSLKLQCSWKILVRVYKN